MAGINTMIRKGEQIPQTVESLLEVMAADAVLLQDAHREIAKLKSQVNDYQQRLKKIQRRIEQWERGGK